MKNIFLIVPKLYPCDIGGLEIFFYYLVNELKNEYNIWLFTNCRKFKLNDINGNNIQIMFSNNLISLNPSFESLLGILINLIKIRKKLDYILVPYTSNSILIYPILIFYSIFKIPYLISIHGGGLYSWKPYFIHKYFFRKAKHIIAASLEIKKEYESRADRKVIYIPPLIPFNKQIESKKDLKTKYGLDQTTKVIIVVGSIKKIKGSIELLEGFMQLGKDFIDENNLKLIFAGEGSMKKSLEKIVKERKFRKYVKFFGNLPHEKIHEIYGMADIYIIASYFEGTPKSLLEAMFNGLPIIGSDVMGINNLINNYENGLLFESKNSLDLAQKIKLIVSDDKLAKKLGAKAKEDYLRNYSIDKVVSEYKKLLEK